MKASVIITSHNGRRYLEKCLDSVLSQDLDGGFEVIVVDNCSTDEGPDLIRDCYPQVRLFLQQRNSGFAAACNYGGRVAVGDILVFLNQDTMACPGWLRELVEGLTCDPKVGLATSKVLLLSSPDRVHARGITIHYTGFGQTRGKLGRASSADKRTKVAGICGASFAVKREVWACLGGFDESLFMYYEDVDLSWRAQLSGYQCLYAPSSVVHHDYRRLERPGHAASYYSARNRLIIPLKNWRWQTLLILLPAFLLLEMVDFAFQAKLGKSYLSLKIQALFAVGLMLPEIVRKRRGSRFDRVVSDAALMAGFSSDLTSARELSPLEGLVLSLVNACFYLHRKATIPILEQVGV